MKKILVGVATLTCTLVTATFFSSFVTATASEIAVLPTIPTDGYSQCQINNSNVTLATVINNVVAGSPIDSFADGDPNDEDGAASYQVPTAQERVDLAQGINFVISGQATSAISELSAAGYEICKGSVRYTTGGTDLLIYDEQGMSPGTTSEGRPMLLLHTEGGGASEGMVFSGPHLNEAHIQNQIVDAFDSDSYFVKAAVLAGTHRCNQIELAPSQFQGETDQCGGDYRTSDMAHNTDTDFQVMHDVLRDNYPQTFNVQLHGMSAAGVSVSRGDDPNDGSATHPTDAVTRAHEGYSRALKDAMALGGITPNEQTQIDNLTSCTPYVNSYTDENALTRDLHCGGTNAQLWSEQTTGDADRWIHIEQSLHVRQNNRHAIQGALEDIYAG